ncbi:MAG: nicotinate-nucleotide--dimethylbenzimidazole phosphoribosyltransferase [Oscillospiraceae bacterium]|nr:nicotinate-nucleotide--dimethylbenzimidazole phosphoribosyltransferase [Oscillospiraceae bacterium]
MLIIQVSINFVNVHANSRFEISLKNRIFKKLLKKDYISVSAYHSGELLNRIKPLDEYAMAKAESYQQFLAKPPKSLARLENLSIQLAGITGKVHNTLDKKHLLVFAADNGVVEEGVASAPQSVTLQQTINLTRAKTGASVLAKHFGNFITVCDVGVNADIKEPAVLNRKIAYGTNNIAKGPAMTRSDAEKAILIGAQLVADTDSDIYGIGEMGIGNTTTSSAVLSVILGADIDAVTGRGGGITDQSFAKKKAVIKQAIEINKPDKNDVIDVLCKVGGFDIAAMCGAFLGCAANRKPVVIDGFISAVAALCAYKICPTAKEYFIPSHASYEIGYKLAMDEMGLQPMLLLGMRLGEGSGCPLAFEIVEAACAVINNMATFENAGINDDYLEEIRKGDKFSVEAKG